jgi:hypothetical protein
LGIAQQMLYFIGIGPLNRRHTREAPDELRLRECGIRFGND